MKTISELLDQIKAKHSLKSDYKLALYLGIGGGNLANYRHGRSLPDEAACEKIAAALNMDADVLIAEMNATRAKTPEVRATWARIAHRLQAGMAQAGVLMLLAIVSIAGYAQNAGATVLSFDKSATSSVYYVKSIARFFRALKNRLRDMFARFAQGINHVQSADTDAFYLHAA